jgi:hypothetical protein
VFDYFKVRELGTSEATFSKLQQVSDKPAQRLPVRYARNVTCAWIECSDTVLVTCAEPVRLVEASGGAQTGSVGKTQN